jgi:hypothetical protein
MKPDFHRRGLLHPNAHQVGTTAVGPRKEVLNENKLSMKHKHEA